MRNLISLSLLTALAFSCSAPALLAQTSDSDMGFAPPEAAAGATANTGAQGPDGGGGSTSSSVSGQTGDSGSDHNNDKTKGGSSGQSNNSKPQIPQTYLGGVAQGSVSGADFHDSHNLGFKGGMGGGKDYSLPATGTGAVKADITDGYQ